MRLFDSRLFGDNDASSIKSLDELFAESLDVNGVRWRVRVGGGVAGGSAHATPFTVI